ncbi:MAG: beta-hydroxyacyl-ACP dehydratase [Thermoguttaceae bacterium]|nr:beta-hydroxyacyl-ACP dehydratase [Thermoguttaceae bacterium]
MHFSLIDKIDVLEPHKKIVATKSLSLAEDYLQDHFPKFPVMPGVLMIEAMTEAAAWLVRQGEDFAHSMVLLKEVKNVKFGQFLQPGQTLTLTATLVSEDDDTAVFKADGSIEGQSRVRAQLVLTKYNLGDKNPSRKTTDRDVIDNLRKQFNVLWRGTETGK